MSHELPETSAFLRDARPSLLRFLGRLVGETDAEDVAQVAMAKAARALPAFRGEASARTWLFQIARNAAKDWIRAHGRGADLSDEVDEMEAPADATVDASQERRLVRAQMSQCVGELLSHLPEGYRAVLALSDCDELSDSEIASILGVTLGAAKIRLHRARIRLRQEFERDCSFYRDDRNVLCCERKEEHAEGAYPFEGAPRLQVRSRGAAASPDNLNEEKAMTAVEALTPVGFEMVRIEKTKFSCALCEEYAEQQASKPIVVMSCEGACLRGEISRQAANHLCHELVPDKTARLCLGGAFTKDTGQRALVRNAKRVVALEGCGTLCASRMMRGHFPDLRPEVVVTDGLCEFDRSLFGAEELPPEEVRDLGRTVAAKVAAKL